MRNVKSIVNKLKKEYKHYQFEVMDDNTFNITSKTHYKDLIAWQHLEREITNTLDSNETVKFTNSSSIYELGIQEWNKDLCYLQFEVNFYQT